MMKTIKQGDKIVVTSLPDGYVPDRTYPLLGSSLEAVGKVIRVEQGISIITITWTAQNQYATTKRYIFNDLKFFTLLSSLQKNNKQAPPKFQHGDCVYLISCGDHSPSPTYPLLGSMYQTFGKIMSSNTSIVGGALSYLVTWSSGETEFFREDQLTYNNLPEYHFYEPKPNKLSFLVGKKFLSYDKGETIQTADGCYVFINRKNLFNKIKE